MRAFHNLTQGNPLYRSRVRQSYVEWVVSTRDRSMLVDRAEIGLMVEEDATIVDGTETHDGSRVVKLDPKRITGRHRNFIMRVKADEFEWGSASSVNDSFNISVGDTNDGVAAAVTATSAPKFQIPLPVFRCHRLLE